MKTIRRIVVGALTIVSLLGGAGVAAAVSTGTATAAAHQSATPDAMMAY